MINKFITYFLIAILFNNACLCDPLLSGAGPCQTKSRAGSHLAPKTSAFPVITEKKSRPAPGLKADTGTHARIFIILKLFYWSVVIYAVLFFLSTYIDYYLSLTCLLLIWLCLAKLAVQVTSPYWKGILGGFISSCSLAFILTMNAKHEVHIFVREVIQAITRTQLMAVLDRNADLLFQETKERGVQVLEVPVVNENGEKIGCIQMGKFSPAHTRLDVIQTRDRNVINELSKGQPVYLQEQKADGTVPSEKILAGINGFYNPDFIDHETGWSVRDGIVKSPFSQKYIHFSHNYTKLKAGYGEAALILFKSGVTGILPAANALLIDPKSFFFAQQLGPLLIYHGELSNLADLHSFKAPHSAVGTDMAGNVYFMTYVPSRILSGIMMSEFADMLWQITMANKTRGFSAVSMDWGLMSKMALADMGQKLSPPRQIAQPTLEQLIITGKGTSPGLSEQSPNQTLRLSVAEKAA